MGEPANSRTGIGASATVQLSDTRTHANGRMLQTMGTTPADVDRHLDALLDLASDLDPYVREKYVELWALAQHPDDDY